MTCFIQRFPIEQFDSRMSELQHMNEDLQKLQVFLFSLKRTVLLWRRRNSNKTIF